MYLQSWQIFILGCLLGIVISFIVIVVMIFRNIGFNDKLSNKDNKMLDLIAKLDYVLIARKLITQADTDFILDKITFSEWRKTLPKDEVSDENREC